MSGRNPRFIGDFARAGATTARCGRGRARSRQGLCADRTGHVLAVAGSQMYIYKVVQSAGKFKDEGAAWTAQEIAENWDAISKV